MVDLSQSAGLLRTALTGDGQTLVTGHEDGAVKLWDVATGQILEEYAAPDQPYTLTISSNGQRVAVGYISRSAVLNALNGQILKWNPQPSPWLIDTMTASNSGTMVIDRTTRECWQGLPFSFPYSGFLAESATMVRFQPNGLQFFDLPPVRPAVSMLAWALLAVAAALTGVWWRLRQRRRVQADASLKSLGPSKSLPA